MSNRWIIAPPSPLCGEAAAKWRVPSLIAQILINRGVLPDQPCDSFLSPQLRDLHPPRELPGAIRAAELIVEAVRARKKIVIYGDYDVDGTMGVAILWHVLRLSGVDATCYVPHRIEEGYGLNRAAVNRLVDDGAEIIVTVDCGITAVEIADELRGRGVPLIITDHHAPRKTLPNAAAIAHPAIDQNGLSYPNPNLCGAGVAFKVAWALAQQICGTERVAPEYRELLSQLLPLVALGTVADVVPLTGENRIITRYGLAAMSQTALPGLRALIESAGLAAAGSDRTASRWTSHAEGNGLKGGAISAYDAGFKLAPRINAAGRMGHASLAVELFTRADGARARKIAQELDDYNRARRSAELKIATQAHEMIERKSLAGDGRRAIVLASNEWHGGVIGIVAGRLVAKYHRPTVLVAVTDREGQGSARSVAHFDLAAALSQCAEHLLGHGGHAMAAGLRIAHDRLESFTEAFVELANNRLTGEDLVPKLRIDAEAPIADLTQRTVNHLLALAPFGLGNPRPLLATDWIELASEPRCVGAKDAHLQASFRQNGSAMRAIGFGLGSRIEDLKQHRRCRVAFEPVLNDYQGRQSVEMRIVDLQFASA